jgi:FolB domain-containing protein
MSMAASTSSARLGIEAPPRRRHGRLDVRETAAMTTDRIHIEGLRLRTVIGLNDWERETRQDVRIDITAFVDVRAAGRSDSAEHILDYKALAKEVIAYVESSEHYLVEALATAIARICVVGHGAERAVVRVDKPGALRFADTVAVEIERASGDFEEL